MCLYLFGNSAVVEGFDRYKIMDAAIECAQLNRRLGRIGELVCELLIAQSQPVAADAPQNVVAGCPRRSSPVNSSITVIMVANRGDAFWFRRCFSPRIAEQTKLRDREVGGADMAVDVPNKARADWRGKLEIGVGPVAARRLRARDLAPRATVIGRLEPEFCVDVRRILEAPRLKIGEIDLRGAEGLYFPEINRQRFLRPIGAGNPKAARVFVSHIGGAISAEGG